MYLRSFFYLLALLVSSYYTNAQTLTWFHVDSDAVDPGGFHYYNALSLQQNKISYSFSTDEKYNTGLYAYGDITSKAYNADGTFIDENSCADDSLFIRKTLILSNGDKIVVGNTYEHYALYDLDTTIAPGMWGEVRSFIHHLDGNNETIRFYAYEDVMDIVTDADEHNLYFVNRHDWEDANILQMNLSTGAVETIAAIEGPRFFPRLLKTQDYIYIVGATISPVVSINGTEHDVDFPYANIIIQFNNDGSYNTVNMIEDITTSRMGLAAAPDQGIYYSGDLHIATQVGNHFMEGPDWGSDFLLARLDTDGNYIWTREAPNGSFCSFEIASGYHLDSDEDYNVYIAGGTRFLLEWDDGTVIGRDTNITTPTMIKWNSNGSIIGHIIAEDGQAGAFNSMDVNANGDFVLTGLINDNFTFDGQAHFVIDEAIHPYVLYYKNETASVVSENNEDDFSIYPNVLGENQLLQINKSNAVREKLTAFDIHGRIVHTENIQGTQNTIKLPALPSGTYVLQVGNRKGESILVIK